jgi:hypothetical protein
MPMRLEAQVKKPADVSLHVFGHRQRWRWLGVFRQQMGRFQLLHIALGP